MKKLMMILVLCCAILAGCGNNKYEMDVNAKGETQNETEKEETKEFSVNESELENDGYEKILDIAYVKMESDGEKTVAHIVYCKNEPEIAFYLIRSIMEMTGYDCDFYLEWDGDEYVFNDETQESEDIKTAFPKDWGETVESIKSGTRIEDMISKSMADSIDREVESVVSKYKQYGQLEVIAKKEYEVDGDTICLCLEKRNDKIDFSIDGTSDSEEKAFLILSAAIVEFDNLDGEFYSYSSTIQYDNLHVIYQKYSDNPIITGTNRDGSIVSEFPDWIDKDINSLEMGNENTQEYMMEIELSIQEFGRTAGYEMGALLEK